LVLNVHAFCTDDALESWGNSIEADIGSTAKSIRQVVPQLLRSCPKGDHSGANVIADGSIGMRVQH